MSFGVRSCLSARRRSDCRRRFVFALVVVFAAADLGFWFSFRRAGRLFVVLFAALGVIAESLRAESCFAGLGMLPGARAAVGIVRGRRARGTG